MNTYETYLKSPSGNTITIDEMIDIYNEMGHSIASCSSEDKKELADDLFQKSCYYANIRTEWEFMDRAQKVEKDNSRTMAHDGVIRSLDILARLINNSGGEASWREKLGNDRKRIGDFACFISFIIGINNR